MKFQGIIPPVITPHHADGSIDHDGFCKVLDHLVTSGVDAIIVGGSTGEYYAQTREERLGLVKRAIEHVAGRVPIIVGVGATRTEDCIDYGVNARDLGADAILVNAPPYAVPTQEELAEHALAIDGAVNLPIMLYNYPGRTGTMMEAEFFDRISHAKNFMAIKESSGDINQLHMLVSDYPNLSLMCGMDDQALEFFAWGAEGWVCGGGNCLPAEHIALYRACVIEKDFDKGRRIMSAIMPFMSVLEQGGKFVQSIKYACELTGLPAGPVRKPLLGMSDEQQREVEDIVNTLKASIADITAGNASAA